VQSVGFEFETEEQMLKTAKKLWSKHGISGELEMAAAGSKFRLNIHSEKPLRDSLLNQIPGKRTQAKAAFGTPVQTESADDDEDN
jgi:hypothetical protein